MLWPSGKNVSIGIWDTAGSEKYHSIGKIYYRNAYAAIVCFDINDTDSLKQVPFWINELQSIRKTAKIYICGCKSDLTDNIADEAKKKVGASNKLNEMAELYGAKLHETSAKTGQNIEKLFGEIASDYLEDPSSTLTSFQISADGEREKTIKICCYSYDYF